MAIISNQPGAEDDEKKKEEQPGSSALIGSPAGGAGGSSGGFGSAASGFKSNAGPSSSGSFTDAGKYQAANKNRIGQFANQVTSTIGNQIAEGEGKVKSQVAAAEAAANAARLDPTLVAGKSASDINIDQGQHILSGGSTVGPTVLDTGTFDQGETQAGLGKSFSGKQTLLNQQLSPSIKDYSSGERRLDAMFLSQDPGSQQTFQNLENRAAAGRENITSQQAALNNIISGVNTTNAEVGANFGRQLGTELGDLTRNQGVDPQRELAARQYTERLIGGLKEKYRVDPQSMTKNELDTLTRYNSGGLGHGAAGQLSKTLLSEITAGNPNSFAGYSNADRNKLNALIQMTQGTGYSNIAQDANAAYQQGQYDPQKINEMINAYFAGGGPGGATRGSGTSNNTLPVQGGLIGGGNAVQDALVQGITPTISAPIVQSIIKKLKF